MRATPTRHSHDATAARAKLGITSTYAKLAKTAADKRYPHSSFELGDIMLKGCQEFEEDNAFGEFR